MEPSCEVFIIGCGYVGRQVAAAEQARGRRVGALTHSPEKIRELRTAGIDALPGNLDRPETLSRLPLHGAVLYYFAPPPGRGSDDPRMAALVDHFDDEHRPARVVLISTTGVYGDCGGAWVDEDWPTRPQTDRARRRLSAERTLREWGREAGVPVVVLRVPGLYGPGRLPLARLKKALPVLREDLSPWSNRIHATDLVRACLAAADRGRPDGVYNVADGNPSTMTDYFNRVADAFGLPRPPQIGLDEARERLSGGMLSYLAESKRLDTRRMREELGVEPRFPDLDSGLAHCVTTSPSG